MKTEKCIIEDVRSLERTALQNLLMSNASFIHVLGCPGSGKTSLVREALQGKPCAYIDSNLCGSIRGLMSSILRALHVSKFSIASEAESSDLSDVEIKEEVVSTTIGEIPKVSSLCDDMSRKRRAAAVVADAKIASRKSRIRRVFIDEASDDENLGNLPEIVKTKINVHRLLHRGQQLRVRTESAFLQKLEIVLLRLNSIIPILVLDNIDNCEPAFLQLLSRLPEFGLVLSIVLISSKILPLSSRMITVRLRPYTKEECEAIIVAESEDSRFAAFSKIALGFLYPSFCGNFVLLRNTLLAIYESNRTDFADPKMIAIKAKTHVVTKMQALFGGSDESSFNDQVKELNRVKTEIKWLSFAAKQVLIAGYLASHNPSNHDKTIFKTGANSGKKNRATTTAFKAARLAADCIQIRAPVPFNLHRLEKIFFFLSKQEDVLVGLLHVIVRQLVHCGLFKTTSADWLANDNIRFNCHAPLDLIGLVAKQVGVQLDEVLFA